MNNISDIIPPSRRPRPEFESVDSPLSTPYPPAPSLPPRPLKDGPLKPPSSGKGFPYGTAVLALLVIIGSVAVLYAFTDAKVSITPAAASSTVSTTLTATPGTGDLPYEIVVVEKTASQSVPAESTETVNDPASGKITIYNAQNTPQTLIKNTRFQTPAGLIFRIHDSVSIPGGSVSSPGSKEVMAYADAGGDSYNIDATTFTIPGLKGSKSFDLVTAKASGPMTGGFSGTRASVTQATRDAQNVKNKEALQKSLADGLTEKIPEGYVLIAGGTFTSFEGVPDTAGKDNTVTVSQKGTIQAVVFPQGALAKAIAHIISISNTDLPVSLSDTKALTLSSTNNLPPNTGEPYTFSLSGSASIVWDVDTARVAGAVAGKTRESARLIIDGFPEVGSANLVVRPFWKSTFPEDPAKIKVEIVTTEIAK